MVSKPKGLTSFQVIKKIKHHFKFRKIGHMGTLDPDASGLLVICVEHATKIAQYLIAEDKTYVVDFRLGVESDTFDNQGVMRDVSNQEISQGALEHALAKFQGEISQQVPIFSAVKVGGRKLYDYARQGKSVTPPTKKVRIYELHLKNYSYPVGQFQVRCSKGTYMRSLVHDIGRKLNVGGVTTNIFRIKSGTFSIEEATSLDDVLTWDHGQMWTKLQPIQNALADLCSVIIPEHFLPMVMNGMPLSSRQLDSCNIIYSKKSEAMVSEPALLRCSKGVNLALGDLYKGRSFKITRLLVDTQ
ncbi:MAG: tRNA pseudouridine(55) synthase TruB [Bdellovibrionales bacterium]|nr:tRNA pseudouridine(55) synthase TruB [Bdellovibrionales bacterium]